VESEQVAESASMEETSATVEQDFDALNMDQMIVEEDPLDFESEGSTHYAIRNFYYKLL
jgi:hypothetical protein